MIAGILYAIHKIRSKKRKLTAAAVAKKKEIQEGKNKSNNDVLNNDMYEISQQHLPYLHKQYQRYSSASFDVTNTPNEYNHVTATPDGSGSVIPIYVAISSDSATLHDNTTPPRGFSFDHTISSKPNQVRDSQQQQQQPSFIDQQQHSSGSLQLLPSYTISNTPTSTTKIPLNGTVKPSAI